MEVEDVETQAAESVATSSATPGTTATTTTSKLEVGRESTEPSATTPTSSQQQQQQQQQQQLPKNRFELELEFLQSLASPAYLHYLATNNEVDLMDPASSDGEELNNDSSASWIEEDAFIEFLEYLQRTWTKPEYSRFLIYPQCLYFLDWLLLQKKERRREWAQVAFRNFAHQQQFLTWQHRSSRFYGRGFSQEEDSAESNKLEGPGAASAPGVVDEQQQQQQQGDLIATAQASTAS